MSGSKTNKSAPEIWGAHFKEVCLMRLDIAIISVLAFSSGMIAAFDVLADFEGKEKQYIKWAGRICCGMVLWMWIVLV